MASEKIPLFDLSGRVAVVTGGGTGLGREFCDALAEFGADVVCVARHQETVDETCGIIERHGHKTLGLTADVADFASVHAMFGKVVDTFGRVDILVNNAGISSHTAPIHETDIDEWKRVLDVNLNGVFYCMREGLRLMAEREKGVVINISSITGLTGSYPDIEMKCPYATSKAGVVGLTRQGAVEYARQGIRVNCICPGYHLGTNLARNIGVVRSEADARVFREKLKDRTPMHRTADPKELKGLLVYLASDASSFTTGQIITSDGGWTVW